MQLTATKKRSKEMRNKIKRTVRSGAEDRLAPFEVAVLSRVVRASIIPEADLVFAWGMGPWATPALDGLLKRELVGRRQEVSQFIGQEGFPRKPGPWIIPTKAGTSRMPKELDVAFPPSGNWITFDGLPLKSRPPDLLMQLIEFFYGAGGRAIGSDPRANIRPAQVLKEELLTRIGEIKTRDGSVGGKD
jgi:hypothetical protein